MTSNLVNPRTTKPGPFRLAIPIVATAVIGTGLYYRTRTSTNKTPRPEDLRNQRSSDGLTGAGLSGRDFPSGGAHQDRPKTDAPREELPSNGAIGAGEGGGSTNVRAADMFQGNPSSGNSFSGSKPQSTEGTGQAARSSAGESAQKDTVSHSAHSRSGDSGPKASSGESTGSKLSQGFQGLFGQGGKSTSPDGESNPKKLYHDTRILSQDTGSAPSKRGPDH